MDDLSNNDLMSLLLLALALLIGLCFVVAAWFNRESDEDEE